MPTQVRPPLFRMRIAFLSALILNSIVASAPLMLFLDRASWLSIPAVAALGVAVFYLLKYAPRQPRRADAVEFLATFTHVLVEQSLGVLFLFLIYGGIWAVVSSPGAVGLHFISDPARVARIGALGVGAAFMVIFLAVSADRLRDAFFPAVGIGNPPLYPGLTLRRFLCFAVPTAIATLLLASVAL